MATIQLSTYHDAVEYLIGYAGGDAQTKTLNDCQRSILNGYREFHSSFEWTYLFQRGRIVTVAPYATGTITYTNATRTVTLSGGTWPTWAAFGTLLINNIAYEIASRATGTTLILTQTNNPGADLAAGTAYSLYRDTYPMPCDYQKGFDMLELISGNLVVQIPARNWLDQQQMTAGPAKPSSFAIMADPNYMGVLAARFYQRPDQAYNFDFIYYRRPRQLNILDYNDGTATVGNGTTTVTGTSTAWASKHVGAVIRFSANGGKNPPTSLSGAYPYAYERVVTGVTSAGALEVDEVLPEDLTNVKYRISDPLDIEEGACMTAFYRESEKQLRLLKRMNSLADEKAEWSLAYERARESDGRRMSPRVAGEMQAYRRRITDNSLSGPDNLGS